MKVLPIPAFYDNYIWLIIDEKKQQAFCVDPGDAKPVFSYLQQNQLKLSAIILTHHHDDHIGGTEELIKVNPGIPVFGPEDQRIPQVTHYLKNAEEFYINQCHFIVISTPGHTSTHISLYEPHYGWLFCGDTLFSAGCGRVFDGSIEALYDSLQKLKDLPEETKVFCAHEYTEKNLRFAAMVEPNNLAIRHDVNQFVTKENLCSLPSSIKIEKQINPFLRTETAEVQHYVNFRGNITRDALTIFKQIRKDKDHF